MYLEFFKQVGFVLGAAWAVGGYPLYRFGSEAVFWSVVVGCGVCTLNVLAGGFTAVWVLDKPQPVFFKVLMGGTGIRLLILGVMFFLIVRFSNIHISGLTGSLFLFYVLFQIIEIRFLVKHLSSLKTPKEGV